MSSSIFFKFKSRKDALQINFDGNSLSVFEVKREIIKIASLGDGKEFDLDIMSPDTKDIYDDDTTEIPRSTTVEVLRKPAQRPGAGRAARYVTGQAPLHARNTRRSEGGIRGNGTPISSGNMGSGAAMSEEEKLLAVMNASNVQLKADLEMSAGKPVIRNSFNKSAPVPDKPLPPSYVCHRCGEKGHWIQACPTNNDPNFDGKHKFKRTTGIPRSMLEVVEKPEGVGEDGKIDPSKLDKGLMYTASGEWVRARPDQAAWQKFQDQQNATNEKKREIAQGDQDLRDRGLECSIDMRPFVNPVKTPCCGKTYCHLCIENAVLEADLMCPNCGEQVLLDDFKPDTKAVESLAEFEAEKKAERAHKDEKISQSPMQTMAASPQTRNIDSPPLSGSKSPRPGLSSVPSKPEKRPADEELQNDRKPAGPATGMNITSVPGNSVPPVLPSAPVEPVAQRDSTPQPPKAPKSMNEFVHQMNAMSGQPHGMSGMAGMENGFTPMMGGMAVGMGGIHMNGMPMAMMNMPPFGMMNGLSYTNMNMNMGMNADGSMMSWQQQQQQQQQQPWMSNSNGMLMNTHGMMQNSGGGNDGAYFRQPVNPHRHQGKQRRQRSVDYKQM